MKDNTNNKEEKGGFKRLFKIAITRESDPTKANK
jgi:hypothetical protein